MNGTGRFDVIVVGAGHNGLVCGARLAKAGLRTLILERRSIVGGACVTEELWPGFHVSTTSYVLSMFPDKIVRELHLDRFGFELIPTDQLFVPFEDGRAMTLWNDQRETCKEIAKFSEKDAAAYPDYAAFLGRARGTSSATSFGSPLRARWAARAPRCRLGGVAAEEDGARSVPVRRPDDAVDLRLPREVVRVRSDHRDARIHGLDRHLQGTQDTRERVRPVAPQHLRARGRGRMGVRARRDGRSHAGTEALRRELRRDRADGLGGRAGRYPRRARRWRHADEWQHLSCRTGRLQRRPEDHLPSPDRPRVPRPRRRSRRRILRHLLDRFQDQLRARRATRVHGVEPVVGTGTRLRAHRAIGRVSREGLRRREIRPAIRVAVDVTGHPDHGRHDARAAGGSTS